MNMLEPARFSMLAQGMHYNVPGNHEEDVYICPISGGADSTILALLLKALAPHINWRYVFTDTGAEEREIYQQLERLEAWLQSPIERLGEKSLFEVCKSFGKFLPSPTDRYCTRILKLQPFQAWLKQFEGKRKWIYVGIRADESSRLAFTLADCETVMPFIDLGITREWVYQRLANTVGIPKSYQTRSRSGCTVCVYQRSTEIVGLLQRNPQAFKQGSDFEKLSQVDAKRHAPGPQLWEDTKASANWLSLPVPVDDAQIGGKVTKKPDLFGRRIFVAGEFFYAGFPGTEPFIWHQRVVTFSSTLHGIKKQLDGRYQHLLGTAEVYGMDAEDVRRDARFAIWYIELPSDILDPDGTNVVTDGDRSYTWHSGKSYRQIQHVITWATRVLHAEFEMQLAARRSSAPLMSVVYEWSEAAQATIDEATHPLGQVLLSEWYQPSEKVVEPETEMEMLIQTPCPLCQI